MKLNKTKMAFSFSNSITTDRCYYCHHFAGKKIKVLRGYIPKVTYMVRDRAMTLDSKIYAPNHQASGQGAHK